MLNDTQLCQLFRINYHHNKNWAILSDDGINFYYNYKGIDVFKIINKQLLINDFEINDDAWFNMVEYLLKLEKITLKDIDKTKYVFIRLKNDL